VGYAPFTRECLNRKYIRHELGERCSDEALSNLVSEYEKAKLQLKKDGFNVDGIFDAIVLTDTHLRQKRQRRSR
jgi:hypothetical protein